MVYVWIFRENRLRERERERDRDRKSEERGKQRNFKSSFAFADRVSSLDESKDSRSISCRSGQRNASVNGMGATAGVAEVAAGAAEVAVAAACRASQRPLARPRTMRRTSGVTNWYCLRY